MGCKKRLSRAALLLAAALVPVLMGACADNGGFNAGGRPALAEYVGTRQVTGDDGVATGLIDYTNADAGYVAVQVTAPTRARAVIKGPNMANSEFDAMHLNSSGEMVFLPLAYGSGRYTVALMYHDGGDTNAYYPLLEAEVQANIPSEYAPFTTQSHDVGYGPSSECVQFSYELTQNCATDLEVAQMIYWWVSENISYDTAKAARVSASPGEDTTPSPDATLRQKTGICYDYASLTAAMLRANGIPCRLVIGQVATDTGAIVHAWNHIWLEDVGFVAVKISVNPDDWTRIDATFSAAGESQAQFIGNGSNYADMYYH